MTTEPKVRNSMNNPQKIIYSLYPQRKKRLHFPVFVARNWPGTRFCLEVAVEIVYGTSGQAKKWLKKVEM